MSVSRHYVGPVGKILGDVLRSKAYEDVSPGDDGASQMHAEIVRQIAKHFAERSAGFQLQRFVNLAGYDDSYAANLAKSIWNELPAKTQSKLGVQERVLHTTGWWRV